MIRFVVVVIKLKLFLMKDRVWLVGFKILGDRGGILGRDWDLKRLLVVNLF